jgi:hypothetical protein
MDLAGLNAAGVAEALRDVLARRQKIHAVG